MNQGRIWCVVKPTVGLPLFLGSVALTSLAVHTAVLNNTPWMANFYSGKDMAATAAVNIKGTSPVVLKTDDGKAAWNGHVFMTSAGPCKVKTIACGVMR